MLRTLVIAAAFVIGTSAAASAQGQARPANAKNDRSRRAKTRKSATPAAKTKPKTFIFDGDDVGGSVQSPDGDTMVVNQPAAHTSLIKLRLNFIPEILKSADDL
jgi:hypothetical protein